MRRFVTYVLLLISIIIGSIVIVNIEKFNLSDQHEQKTEESAAPKIKSNHEPKQVLPLLEGNLFELIGMSTDTLIDTYGTPKHKDMTPYGYTWWVYTDGVKKYVQFGIEDDEIQTIYATGQGISSKPITIGSDYDEIDQMLPFENKVVYQDGMSLYSFLLNENDLESYPLIKLDNNLFVQCYFDTFTNKLSSIRIVTGDVLIKQRFYEMEYRGSLPEKLTFSDEEWKEIEEGMQEQVFELTNVYRNRFDIQPLIQDEQVQEVAYLHSEDMGINNYFSHYSQDGSGLKERLNKKNIYYLSAGENIAAQHTDGPAAMEGWLNSEGHREALLNEEYTHLGVGIYRLYYTQNFLFKP